MGYISKNWIVTKFNPFECTGSLKQRTENVAKNNFIVPLFVLTCTNIKAANKTLIFWILPKNHKETMQLEFSY